jgi:hypothetical protein
MNALEELQKWYLEECNGDWEHSYGVKIETLDNPGWSVTINLEDTYLETFEFTSVSYGVGEEAEQSQNDWLICKKESSDFIGYGGPKKLQEIISIFLNWAKSYA